MFERVLNEVTASPETHARWLNTLSLMENTGARKISASEDPRKVSLEVLKHAAEEARHALFFKSQLQRLGALERCSTYEKKSLLAPRLSRRYLDQLEVQICKHLKQCLKLSGASLRYAAYLLITYAIEKRAEAIYPLYQRILEEKQIPISLKTIVQEEAGHLNEMTAMMKDLFGANWSTLAAESQRLEMALFERWSKALETELQLS